ncbi:hypothetical protein CAPTEDRAFT_91395, partial [Capitella teleta]
MNHSRSKISEGALSVITQLYFKHGVDVNLGDEKGISPLHMACTDGNMKMVKLLLKNDADTNKRDIYGNSPFHFLPSTNDQNFPKHTIKLLIANGADINLQNQNGLTPLTFATLGGNARLVKLLIGNGAD